MSKKKKNVTKKQTAGNKIVAQVSTVQVTSPNTKTPKLTTAPKTTNTTVAIPQRLPAAKLRFSPYAWAKLLYLRDAGNTEVGAFGIGMPDDPLAIIDVVTVKQKVSIATVEFDDESVADFFEDQVELGRKPHHFARVWLHTHPGNSTTPSYKDEETFDRVFGRCDWAIMAILGQDDSISSRLRYSVGIKAEFEIPAAVDYSLPFGASDFAAWEVEYKANVEKCYYNTTKWVGYDGWCNPGRSGGSGWMGHMPGGLPTTWQGGYSKPGQTAVRDVMEWNWDENDELVTTSWEEEDEADEASDGPEYYWPLELELEGLLIEEKAELLAQLDIAEEDIPNYVVYFDAAGEMSAEYNPKLVASYEDDLTANMSAKKAK